MVFVASLGVFFWFILEYQIFDKNIVTLENKGEYFEFYQESQNPELIKNVLVNLENKECLLKIQSNKLIGANLFSFRINLITLPQKYQMLNLIKGEIVSSSIDFINLIFEIK